MANRLITMDEFIADIKRTVHEVAARNWLDDEDEAALLFYVANSMGGGMGRRSMTTKEKAALKAGE